MSNARASNNPVTPKVLATVIWTSFALSLLYALIAIVDANRIEIPYLVFDEWPVSVPVTSFAFWEAVSAGHNEVPSYVQNALWWCDLTFFNYRGLLPLLAKIGGWLLGLPVLFRAMLNVGFSREATTLTVIFLIGLWFSVYNVDQYGYYQWRGVEASGVFLLMACCLLLTEGVVARTACGGKIFPYFALLMTIAWTGLYIHGGMVLLPMVSMLLLCSPVATRYKISSLACLIAYCWYFFQVHYFPVQSAAKQVETVELLKGFAYILSSIPYFIAKALFGEKTALFTAWLLSAASLFVAVWLGLRLLMGRSDRKEVFALFLLLYPILIALIITYVRISQFGAEYALTERYRNYSIYLLTGWVVLLLSLQERQFKRKTPLFFPVSALLVGLSLTSLVAAFISVKNFQYLSDRIINSAVYMIPYTLEKWQLPPTIETTDWRIDASNKIHDTLLARKANVFGSAQYSIYANARQQPLSLKFAPHCFMDIKLKHVYPTRSGQLMEFTAILQAPWAAMPGTVIVSDASGYSLGWAIRHSRLSTRLLEGFKPKQDHVQGYLLKQRRPITVQVLLVSRQQEIICDSKSFTLG